jgi:integrase
MNERQRKEAAEMTLRTYFERIHAPTFLSGAKPMTLKRARESLKHWERETVDPRLAEIDPETLAVFKSRLFNPAGFCGRRAGNARQGVFAFAADPPPPTDSPRQLSRATVNLHLRQISGILSKAGPAGPTNRDALGVLRSVPWTKPLKEYRRRPKNVKDDLLDAIYRAAAAALHPHLENVLAGNWWKALIVTAVTVGYRKGAMLRLPWSCVDWEESIIRLPAEADKCWTEREKPVSRLVLQHLLRIRTASDLIFPFPESATTFYRQWRAIQTAAAIPKDRQIKLHDLKRACGTRFARIASPWVVQHRLDHASLATSQFYVNASDEEREAVDRQPLPAAFCEEFLPPIVGTIG